MTPRSYEQQELPPPLAEPRLDFRVDAATALAYEVRAGEFIQVIDVEGKQCSDFLAFHRAQARVGARARARRDDDALAHGPGVPAARPAGEVLRRRPGSADRGRPRHGRSPRHVRARLHGQVLRGQGLPRPRQLHGELQRAGDAVRDRAAHGLGGAQLLLQHGLRREQRLRHGRAVVAPRRLRPPPRDERPRLRVVGVPRRHRPGERLADHADPRAGVRARQHVLGRDRAPRDGRRRSGAHARDDVPSAHERAHEELRRVPRLLAPALLRQRGRDRRVLGLPREGRDHGPLAAAQVGDARPGRRDARSSTRSRATRGGSRSARSRTRRSATRPAG